MPVGKLRERAGIESLAYAVEGETEVTLGAQAANEALQSAACRAGRNRLDHRDQRNASSLSVACGAASFGNRRARDVRGIRRRWRVPGSDQRAFGRAGADCFRTSAYGGRCDFRSAQSHARPRPSRRGIRRAVWRRRQRFSGARGETNAIKPSSERRRWLLQNRPGLAYRIRDFLFGCADQYAEAVKVEGKLDGSLAVVFEGEALSRAAISRLEKIIAALEKLSSVPRAAVGAFATHQPNPRLLTLLAKVAGVSVGAFPPIATTSGNLGSSTCGAALHSALQMFRGCPESARKPIFLASLGPGLVFGGAWLSPSVG